MSAEDELRGLWNFDEPAASESRFRQVALEARDDATREQALTQVARALGLQGRFDAGHAVLDALRGDDVKVGVRRELERGRLLRSAGDEVAARPRFEAAADRARKAGLEELHIDAMHMRALVVPPESRPAATQEAVALARAANDPRARAWEASLLNNLGMVYADDGDFDEALPVFEDALAVRERLGEPGATRIARWMVAWALRNVGRVDEALTVQRRLKAELEAVGEVDTYVDDELRLLEGGDGGKG